LFSNGGFHNIGSGNFDGANLDFGRVYGIRMALMDEFNCLGPYSDARPRECTELVFLNTDSHVPLEGAFKVPSLRNVARTAPYFHDGRFTNLADVIDYYRTAPASLQPGTHELLEMTLSEAESLQLVKFLETLTSSPDERD
jgi:cytochrome c peroxidase